MKFNVTSLFPYEKIRSDQETAIDFALEAIINQNKKYVIIEAGTGIGKSAVGVTVARFLENNAPPTDEYGEGAYFLTTQKILQDQYVKDYSSTMKSIKSATNYTCKYHKNNSCAEGLRMLKTAEKRSAFFRTCAFGCKYKGAKKAFLATQESVTNFPYFLAETYYSGQLESRNTLVIDEAHNIETQLSKFIEVTITERFVKQTLKTPLPKLTTQKQAHNWVLNTYLPKLRSYFNHMEQMLEKYQEIA